MNQLCSLVLSLIQKKPPKFYATPSIHAAGVTISCNSESIEACTVAVLPRINRIIRDRELFKAPQQRLPRLLFLRTHLDLGPTSFSPTLNQKTVSTFPFVLFHHNQAALVLLLTPTFCPSRRREYGSIEPPLIYHLGVFFLCDQSFF